MPGRGKLSTPKLKYAGFIRVRRRRKPEAYCKGIKKIIRI
jgi:hypothetical protein